MRKLTNVINEMLVVIPEAKSGFRRKLESQKESVSYAAPELHSVWWNEVHSTLIEFIGEKPIEEWEYQVLSIFSTRTVEELKVILNS